MNPCPRWIVVGDSFAKRGFVVGSIWREKPWGPARLMHCNSFCVLCLVDSHLDGTGTNALLSVRGNAAVTSGMDAALCVKDEVLLLRRHS